MKRTFLISVFALAFVLCSCSRPAEEPDPQAALAGYFDAVISGNYEEAAKYLPAQARQQAAAKSQESESFEEKMVRRALASYVSYEIVIIGKTEGKARATAKIKSPDFHRIAMDAAARLIAAKFPRGGIESLEYAAEIVNAQIRSLKAQGIPMVSTIRNYELVKEGGAWKISGSD